MAQNQPKGLKAYWRQVRAVQALTGTSSATARRAVALLRNERDYQTAAETKRHPVIVSRLVKALEAPKPSEAPGEAPSRTTRRTRRNEAAEPPEPPSKPKPYRDLDDWIDTFEAYEGDYDVFEVETNADY